MTFSIYVLIHIFYTEVLLCTTVVEMCPFRYFLQKCYYYVYSTENREVSSAMSFTVDSMFSAKSFIYVCIRKRSGPKIDPCACGTSAFTGNHSEICLFKSSERALVRNLRLP